jgi:hypothetical protein
MGSSPLCEQTGEPTATAVLLIFSGDKFGRKRFWPNGLTMCFVNTVDIFSFKYIQN